MQTAQTDTNPTHTAVAGAFGGVAKRGRILLSGVMPLPTPLT